MNPEESVTHWIEQLKAGDSRAAAPVWERYYARLVELARRRLQASSRAAADEEDVALSAFHTFCKAAQEGRFPRLEDRDDLWRLLVTITDRKALDQARDQRRQKRGGGRVQSESALVAGDDERAGFAGVAGREPTPEFAALMAEECGRLLDRLGDEGLRAVAVCKMEGHSNEEVADRLGCALRTVERKLALIRDFWEQELAP
jgi:DNA-directed RNA polymerase specialized sigma24 family protein